ncbi:hypothetical protein [uncultured Gemmiger sp.]|uniref:hypothetical protein n=1 Tax=uncultured Gemmiger sp. TaxID=1623490 RepID=UPI0025E676C6|nr:hypothetical protein [uncultured Gemmiger sp.]
MNNPVDRLTDMERQEADLKYTRKPRNTSLECFVLYNEMGIHTMELHYLIPPQSNELSLIWKVLKGGERYPKRFSMAGLIPGLFAEMLGHEYCPVLKLLVNPRVMVDGMEGYLGITSYDADTLLRCQDLFDRFWACNNIGIRMENCLIARVDLCVDLIMPEWFSIPEYLDLLKRTPRKKSFILQHYEDTAMERHQFKIANQNWGLSVYDKSFEQKLYPANADKEYPNILRVELQLYRAAIGKAAQKLPAGNVPMLLELMIQTPALLCTKIRDMLGCDPYVSQEKLRACIEQSAYQGKTKNELWKIQHFLYRTDDFEKVADELRIAYGKSAYHRLLRCYREMGAAPVPLRKRSGLRKLPSLFALVGGAIYHMLNQE